MKQDSSTTQVHTAVNDGWMRGGSFFNSLIAGTLIGYFLDQWLGTDPWLVITGIVIGAYAGFVKVWDYMKSLDDNPRERAAEQR